MGQTWSKCSHCQSSVCEDDQYSVWCECGKIFCSKRCGNLQNYQSWADFEKIKPSDDIYNNLENANNRIDLNKNITCLICRGEYYNDKSLFNTILKHFNISYKDAIEIWRKENGR